MSDPEPRKSTFEDQFAPLTSSAGWTEPPEVKSFARLQGYTETIMEAKGDRSIARNYTCIVDMAGKEVTRIYDPPPRWDAPSERSWDIEGEMYALIRRVIDSRPKCPRHGDTLQPSRTVDQRLDENNQQITFTWECPTCRS